MKYVDIRQTTMMVWDTSFVAGAESIHIGNRNSHLSPGIRPWEIEAHFAEGTIIRNR
jgi:hypothetical protein